MIRMKKLLHRKHLIVIIPAILLLILIIAAAPGAIYREHLYRTGMNTLREGDLTGAEAVFSEIPMYRDSDTVLHFEIPYLRASKYKEAAERDDSSMLAEAGYSDVDLNEDKTAAMLLYCAAQEIYDKLDGYRDSAELSEECRKGYEGQVQMLKHQAESELLRQNQSAYDRAVAMLEDRAYGEAITIFGTLGDFKDSVDMITECRYRKAVSIFHFLSSYDVSRISASLSTDPDVTSIFSLPASEALRLGSACMDELRFACGKDRSDIRLEDEPSAQLVPLKDALNDLFESLGDYADSESYSEKIEDDTDYTRDFFMLCSTGDLSAARDWLNTYEGIFPEREKWMDLLSLYLPYCGYWELYLGDASLPAYAIDQNFTALSVSTRVILTRESAVLRLDFGEGMSWSFDLPSELGKTLFINDETDSGYYMGALNNGHFVYMRYDRDWALLSSADYIRG